MKPNNYYPGLKYSAKELSAYIVVANAFIISRMNGELIRFVPDDADNFRKWLATQSIRAVVGRANMTDKIANKFRQFMIILYFCYNKNPHNERRSRQALSS